MLYKFFIIFIQSVCVYNSGYASQESNLADQSLYTKLSSYRPCYSFNNGTIQNLKNKNRLEKSFKAQGNDSYFIDSSFTSPSNFSEASFEDIECKKVFLLLNDSISFLFVEQESELSDNQSFDKFIQDQIDQYIAAGYTKIEVFSSDEFCKKHPQKFHVQSQQNPAFFPKVINDQSEKNTVSKNQNIESRRQHLLAEKERLAVQAAEYNKKEEERQKQLEKALNKKIRREQEEREKQAQQNQVEIDRKKREQERNTFLSRLGTELHEQKIKILNDFYQLNRELVDIQININEDYSSEIRSKLSQLKIEIENEQKLLNECKKDALKKKLINFENSFKKLKLRIDTIHNHLDSCKKMKEAESVQEDLQESTPSFFPLIQSINDPKKAEEDQFLYRIVYCSCLNNNASVLGAPEKCIFCKNEHDSEYKPLETSNSMLNPNAVSFSPGKRQYSDYSAFLRDYFQQ